MHQDDGKPELLEDGDRCFERLYIERRCLIDSERTRNITSLQGNSEHDTGEAGASPC